MKQSVNRCKVGHKRPRSAEKQTRNRTHYNFKQIAVLEEIFEKHLFCPQAERKKVAQILGLTELNVSFWPLVTTIDLIGPFIEDLI